jgi:hypothetical protein
MLQILPLLLALGGLAGPTLLAAEPTAATTAEQVFGTEELDQMLAPLALYPDALLAQVLMAAT